MEQILVGTDGSDGARAAIEDALELAADLDATVTFVYVRRAPNPTVGDPYFQNWVTEEIARGRTALAEAQDLAERKGVRAECELLTGDAASEIVELAKTRDVDLVVVGSHGLGAVHGALLGSVSRAVARHADHGVLIVKHETAPKRLRAVETTS